MKRRRICLSRKIHKILDIMRDGEEFFMEEAKGVLAALLVEIARLNRDSGEDKVAENAGKLTNMITSVLDYVSYHYMEDIKVEDLANICHISETHFRRVFTSYMKMSHWNILIPYVSTRHVNFWRPQMPRLRMLLTNVGLRQIRHSTETLNS